MFLQAVRPGSTLHHYHVHRWPRKLVFMNDMGVWRDLFDKGVQEGKNIFVAAGTSGQR